MEFVDAHAHLCDPVFQPDLDAVVQRAVAAGVTNVLIVGETLADAERNLELAARHADLLKPCVGLYPAHLDPAQAVAIEQLIRDRRDHIVGIGEVGLDFWIAQHPEQRGQQKTMLGRFVDLSLELDLPLNVHSRSAGRHTIAFLKERGARKVLLHAFDGRAAKAEAGVEAGYHFSIPPSVVRSTQKQKLVRALPLSSMILETDSPVLGPDRSRRNEPANAAIAAHAIAELKEIPIEEVAETTTANARKLFGLE